MSEIPTNETFAVARRGLAVFLVAAAVLAVFNSGRLSSAVRDFPPNAVTDRLVLAADQWHGWMETTGAASVVPALRRPFTALHELAW